MAGTRKKSPVADTATALSLPELATWMVNESLLFASEDSPFRATLTPGAPGLLLVVGENASGKSLFFRAMCARAQQAGVTAVSVSIRERTGSGLAEMARMRQAMMFGDETDQSTGAASVRAVAAAFGNLDRPQGSLLALDEPELGLSDGYARALGEYIGAQARTVSAGCAGVVVVTHSRCLTAGLLEGFGDRPTFVAVDAGGDEPAPVDLDAWLSTAEVRTVTELLALPEVGLERFRRTQALLREG